jgi:hypothetical protein
MRQRPYDPSWRALFLPSLADDFFVQGRPRDERALCAELARVAYIGFDRAAGEQQRATDILANAGFRAVTFLSRGGTECFVARDADAALTVVAFRGTASAQDVLTDLMAWRIRWHPGGRAHAGFAWALRRVWPALLQTLTHHSGRLVYTGHSLGGALATLAATLLPPAALYTFGAPRVGNARFAELLRDVDHVRATDCADAVCDVPPSWLGYVHTGRQLYVDRDGVAREGVDDAAQRADRRLARREFVRRFAWRAGNVWTRRLADHAPVNYVTAGPDPDTRDAPL